MKITTSIAVYEINAGVMWIIAIALLLLVIVLLMDTKGIVSLINNCHERKMERFKVENHEVLQDIEDETQQENIKYNVVRARVYYRLWKLKWKRSMYIAFPSCSHNTFTKVQRHENYKSKSISDKNPSNSKSINSDK